MWGGIFNLECAFIEFVIQNLSRIIFCLSEIFLNGAKKSEFRIKNILWNF